MVKLPLFPEIAREALPEEKGFSRRRRRGRAGQRVELLIIRQRDLRGRVRGGAGPRGRKKKRSSGVESPRRRRGEALQTVPCSNDFINDSSGVFFECFA